MEEYIGKGKESGKKWLTSMRRHYADPIGSYRQSITKRKEKIKNRKRLIKMHKQLNQRQDLIDRYERLNRKDEKSIEHLKYLIKREESKKND